MSNIPKLERELRDVAKQVADECGVEFVEVRKQRHFRLLFRVGGVEVASTASMSPNDHDHALNFARQQARRAIRAELARKKWANAHKK
jgi:G:T/U-mismatch repair DNA glycosylase